MAVKKIAMTLAALALSTVAVRVESIKVGFMTTLSGPGAVLGQHMRDGWA
jgi:branched-chain amino acid transport system substrate-binding protein